MAAPYAFDPELAPIIGLLPESDLGDPVAARDNLATLIASLGMEPDTEGLTIEDRAVPGPEGSPDVTVRVYRPTAASPGLPAVLYLHGGGFVLGSIEIEHLAAVGLAQELGVVVASV